MRSWPAPDLPRLSAAGPEVALHDTSTGGLVTPAQTARRGCTSAASRRTTPPTSATRRPTSPSTCCTAPGATRVRRPLRPERHRRRRPAAGAGHQGRRRLGRAGRARDRAVPAGHDGAAGAAAGALRRRGRVDPAGGRADQAAAGRRRGLPGRGRPLLLRHGRPGVRRGVGHVPRRDAADVPRARRRSRPRGQEGPPRLRRVARRAAGRAGLGQPVRPRPPRLAHRVRRHRPGPPRHDLRRAGRRVRPGLPAPRDVRGEAQVATGRPFAQAYAHAGMVPTTARRCRSRAATSSSSPSFAPATSTRWRSG